MIVDIIQQRKSQSSYNVEVNGKVKYTSVSSSDSDYPDIRLFDLNGDCEVFIKNNCTWRKTTYEINLVGAESLTYESVSWRLHYQCVFREEVYDIYGHLGYKYSVFKNNSQIAWWNNLAALGFERDRVRIIANNDCFVELITSFCLTHTSGSRTYRTGNALAIDLGNIIPGVKKFNHNWKPT